MNYVIAVVIFICPLLAGTACDDEGTPASMRERDVDENNDLMGDRIRIKIGDKIFTATLFDNASVTGFKDMLPLTVDMTELNGNEKYFRFPENLPVNASNPGTISAGDLMLWGSDTFVLFYEAFSTSYSYTKIGKIHGPTGLATAVGSGTVTVTFELE